MLNENQILNYKNINNTLLNDSIPDITNVLDITSRIPFDWNSVVLYEKKSVKDNLVDNILVLNFNMKKYILFFNKDGNKYEISEKSINEEYIKLFNDIDIYNYRLRDFRNERIQIKFNLDIFMQFIKKGIH